MRRYGTTEEQMAKVSVKNHKNATKNPHALFGKEVTLEEVMNSKRLHLLLAARLFCPLRRRIRDISIRRKGTQNRQSCLHKGNRTANNLASFAKATMLTSQSIEGVSKHAHLALKCHIQNYRR